MVLVCAFPNCTNKMSKNTSRCFHVLPLRDRERLKLWLGVLQMDANTPVKTLLLADTRVCSDHFDRDDYYQPKKINAIQKHLRLKKNAVPRVERPAAVTVKVETTFEPLTEDALPSPAEPKPPLLPETNDNACQYVKLELQDKWTSVVGPLGHFKSKGTQVNLPVNLPCNANETCPVNTKRSALQHIIDEEAILQLLESCPECNRKCRSAKHVRSPYLIVYQSCYFCDYRGKWASQPEARNINIPKQCL